jgi:dolichol-phosphate mannosyltransferase
VSVSVVVPTLRERESLERLIPRLEAMARAHQLELQVIVVDDDSRDGTREWLEAMAFPFVQLGVRKGERGLASAVLHGLRAAKHEHLVVMDADLSHPPEKIPELVAWLLAGADLAMGTRYAEGASTGDDWGFLRWLNSRVATWLTRPLTRVSDPMSGFFAVRSDVLARADDLQPIGYKIGLEILVKSRARLVAEVPIHFAQRRYGESKLTVREQLRFLRHLRRLYVHRFGAWTGLQRFAVIGLLGVAVNLGVLEALLALGAPAAAALTGGVGVSLAGNLVLSRRFTFSPRSGASRRDLARLVVGTLFAAALNLAAALAVLGRGIAPELACLAGIGAGAVLNLALHRFRAFKSAHYQSDV